VSLFTSSTGVDEPDEVRMPNGDTLVQYMGGREATATAQRLLALGHAPDTPVVVVETAAAPTSTSTTCNWPAWKPGCRPAAGRCW
jgi:uroporphyrin-III C-methyltransferase